MSKSFCSFCGEKLDKNDIFCKECGAKVEKNEEIKDAIIEKDKSEKKEISFMLYIITFLLIVISFITLLLILFKK